MPSLDLKKRKLRYAKTDETALDAAYVMAGAIADYETNEDAKRDATTARTAIKHLLEHVRKQRNGKPETKEIK